MIRGVLTLALLASSAPSLAQDERPTGYPRSANERSDHAVALSAVYTADIRSNVDGGVRRGMRYLDNLDLQIALDTDRLLGWRGARVFVYGIYDNGTSISRLVGDVQTISNIETRVGAARLFEAWIEQDVGHSASIKVGIYNLNSEFDTTQSGGLFLLSSHGIGPEIAQTGRAGPSVFPLTSLAVRGEAALGEHWVGRIAVLDGVPGDPDYPRRTAVRLSARDGALVIGEIDYLKGGTKAAIGVWGYTARFDPLIPSAAAERGNRGAYILAEHRLSGSRNDDPRGLAGWLRFGVADPRYNPVARYVGGGLVHTGIAPGRADDQIGLSFASVDFGSSYRRSRAIAGETIGDREVVIEAAYTMAISPWLSVQPDVQYVIDPGGRGDLKNALVLGLRVKIGR